MQHLIECATIYILIFNAVRPTNLVQAIQQIQAAALAIEALGIGSHAQLQGQHRHARLQLRFLLGVPQGPHASHVAHVPHADQRHIHAFCRDTHARHVFPDLKESSPNMRWSLLKFGQKCTYKKN